MCIRSEELGGSDVCSELTEDEGVFVVLGAMLGDNPLCVTQLHETPYVGLFGLTAERAEKSIAPFFASEMAADLQRSNSTKALIRGGTFDGVKLAVFWEIADEPVANDVVLPLLEEAGVEVVVTGTLLDYAGDTPASEAALDVIFQNFSAAGADMYLNISGLVPFNRAIDRNRPGVPFVLLNGQLTNSAIIATSGYDPDILVDAIGVTASKPALRVLGRSEGFEERPVELLCQLEGRICCLRSSWRHFQTRSEMRRLRDRMASRLFLPRSRQRW